jgi:hypothetical protein
MRASGWPVLEVGAHLAAVVGMPVWMPCNALAAGRIWMPEVEEPGICA